jgi:hypothetical protein
MEALEPRQLLTSGLRFAVVGDYGFANPVEGQVARRIKSWNPDLLLTTGDNNYSYGQGSTLDANVGQYYHEFIGNYAGVYGAGSEENRFFPTLGNHDWFGASGVPNLPRPYLDYFTLPGNERYYDFTAGPVHFFCLDSDPNEPDGKTPQSVQGQWLQDRMAQSTSVWNVVYFHQSAFSSSEHGSDLEMQWPFKQWGADIVLSGHDHVYERIIDPVDNLPYLVTGNGGNPSLYPWVKTVAGSQVRYNDDWGALKVDATDAQITFQEITRSGQLIDSFTLNASTTAPLSPSDLTASPISARQVDLTWSDNSGDESGFRLERSAAGVAFQTIAMLGPGVTRYSDLDLTGGTHYAYRVESFNTAGDSAQPSDATVVTPAGNLTGVVAPAKLTATPITDSRIDLKWDAVEGAGGYKVEQSADGIVYDPIGTTPAAQTSFSVTGLSPGTVYYYRVRAFTAAAGDSPFANSSTTTLLPPTSQPDLAAASDSGIANDDNITNATTLTFTGLAPAGSAVQILADEQAVGSGTAGPDGTYSIAVAGLGEGTHSISAIVDASPASLPLLIRIDRTPPRVAAIRFNGQTSSTNVKRIEATFDEPVVAPLAQLTLKNTTTGKTTPSASMDVICNALSEQATWYFPALPYETLENGNYTGTIGAGIADLAGNALDGNGNGKGGDGKSFTFYQLPGDANADRVVNVADFRILYTHLGSAALDDPADFDGDGTVGFGDFQIREVNTGRSVPAAAAQPAVAPVRPTVVFARRRVRA